MFISNYSILYYLRTSAWEYSLGLNEETVMKKGKEIAETEHQGKLLIFQ